MDIGSLLEQVGGASAVAQHLGVDASTVERGAGALLPHVANGVENEGFAGAMQQPQVAAQDAGGGLDRMLGGLLQGAAGGGVLGSLLGGGVGNTILGQIFGSKDRSREVATQASQQSGVDPSILKKLLPIVAGAVAMHYITRRRQGGASPGGGALGSILGGI